MEGLYFFWNKKQDGLLRRENAGAITCFRKCFGKDINKSKIWWLRKKNNGAWV